MTKTFWRSADWPLPNMEVRAILELLVRREVYEAVAVALGCPRRAKEKDQA
jgi:hypothetical protein